MDKKSNTINLKIDLRIISIVLALVILGMLALWRPWQESSNDQRKITISGESSIKAEPDEYQFSPAYERKTTAETTELSKQISAKLKELGVDESKIKVDANRYKTYSTADPKEETTTLNMTITVSDKDLAQKVQDYLISTNPSGSVTPYPTFSKTKQKELETKAREEAISDAKKRADNMAEGFGTDVAEVIEIKENEDFAVTPWMASTREIAVDSSAGSLPIQAGENEFTYKITVVFSLK